MTVKLGRLYSDIQSVVLKFMLDGYSKQEAIQKVESILRCKIPDVIKEQINDYQD